MLSLQIVVAVHTGDSHWIVNWNVNRRVTAYICYTVPTSCDLGKGVVTGITIGSRYMGTVSGGLQPLCYLGIVIVSACTLATYQN